MNMFYEIGPRVRARRNTEHFSQQEIYICLIEPGESPLRLRVFFTWVFAAMNNFVIKAVFFFFWKVRVLHFYQVVSSVFMGRATLLSEQELFVDTMDPHLHKSSKCRRWYFRIGLLSEV